jgi:hypothetical protein
MSIRSAPAYEIVRLIDLQPPRETGFCVLIASPDKVDLAAELQKELGSQVSGTLGRIDAKSLTTVLLLEELRQQPNPIVLIDGFENWSNDQFASLDVNRSRLETGAFLLFKTDLRTLGRFFEHAPNLRSFIGANIFMMAPDTASMSPQEIADRLGQLRTYYGFTDRELLERARDGSLPAEPHFAEWLVLLGSNEFVR